MRLRVLMLAVLTSACGYTNPVAPATVAVPTAGVPATLHLAIDTGIGAAGGTAAVSATVSDAFATPVVGASVAFTAAAGTLSQTLVVTDEKGIAATTLIAPPGAVLVTATVGGLESKTLVSVQVPVAPPPPDPPSTPTPRPQPDPTQPFTVQLLVTAGVVGELTTFGLATSPITQAAWTFGDGATITTSGATTTHVYTTVGTFTASVTARSVDGRTASSTATVTIAARPVTPTPVPPPTPVAGYTVTLVASPASVTVGASTTLTATATALNGAPAANSYAWDCTSDGVFELRTTANTTTCSYPTVGVATARVVANNGEISALGTVTISVTAAPVPSYTVTVAASPTSVVAGGSSNLTATVTANNGAPTTPTGYAWDCTNDSTVDATTAGTSCAYPSAGTFTAKLTVTGGGATGSGTTTVTVTAAPPPSVSVTLAAAPNTGTATVTTITFTATATPQNGAGAILSYDWDLDGDGAFDDATTLTNTVDRVYTAPGTYTVRVRANSTTVGVTGTASTLVAIV